MLKVREPEKRFSHYTTITFKRPRPRNNFKHSQKNSRSASPAICVFTTAIPGFHTLKFLLYPPPTWFAKPIDSETEVFVVSNQNLSAPIKSYLPESNSFRIRLEPNFSSKTAFLRSRSRSRSRFRFRFTARVPRFPITSLTPIRSGPVRSTSHFYCHIVENDNHLLAREALD